MFSFSNPILLGCVDTCEVVYSAMLRKKMLHAMRHELSSIVNANFLDMAMELGFDHSKKGDQNMISVRLMMH